MKAQNTKRTQGRKINTGTGEAFTEKVHWNDNAEGPCGMADRQVSARGGTVETKPKSLL